MVNSLLLLVHFQDKQEGNKTAKIQQPEKCGALERSACYLSWLPAWKYSMELTGPARRKPSSP